VRNDPLLGAVGALDRTVAAQDIHAVVFAGAFCDCNTEPLSNHAVRVWRMKMMQPVFRAGCDPQFRLSAGGPAQQPP